MKKTVIIEGKEYNIWDFEKIVFLFCFANLIAQMVIMYLNCTKFSGNIVTRAYLGGLQSVVTPLTLILCIVSIHNAKIYNLFYKKIDEAIENDEKVETSKNVKEKK